MSILEFYKQLHKNAKKKERKKQSMVGYSQQFPPKVMFNLLSQYSTFN